MRRNTKSKFQPITRDRYLVQLRDHALALTQDRTLNTKPLNVWAQRSLEKLEKQGRLVSEQQYQDHRKGRVLRVGDRARYVRADRVERVGDTEYVRPQGQAGEVVKTQRRGGEHVVTFRPDATAATVHVVDLVVLTNTPGYFALERIPEPTSQPRVAGLTKPNPALNPVTDYSEILGT